jgi:16S rRNA (guanine(527)-N(7))-methyltransferase RsmG
MSELLSGLLPLAEQLGLSPGRSQLDELKVFSELLLQWNARINLTGARDLRQVVEEHLPDSLAMSRLVPEGSRLVDVGSGGGLPAIPFGILRRDVEITLVEPRAKRVAFLRTAVRTLALRGQVVEGRAEELIGRGVDYEVAASRATLPPAEWLPLGAKLAGRVLVFAARERDVVAGPGCVLETGLAYETLDGRPRWVGSFVSRGTLESPVPRGTPQD